MAQSSENPGELLPGPQIAGYSVQRDEAQHTFVINRKLVACTPAQYRVLALLLEQADRCVPYAHLIAQLQDGPSADATQIKQVRNRLMHLMSDLRTKIWALGLDIVAVMNTGYMLLSQPPQPVVPDTRREYTSAVSGHKERIPLREQCVQKESESCKEGKGLALLA